MISSLNSKHHAEQSSLFVSVKISSYIILLTGFLFSRRLRCMLNMLAGAGCHPLTVATLMIVFVFITLNLLRSGAL